MAAGVKKVTKESEGGARYLFDGVSLDVSLLLKCHAKPRRCEDAKMRHNVKLFG